MKTFRNLFILLILSTSTLSFAQSDIEVLGFFQARSGYTDNEISLTAEIPPELQSLIGIPQQQVPVTMTLEKYDRTKIYNDVQQLNLFFRKEFNTEFSSWVNLELVNTFSTEREWGELNLEEAWLKYEKSSKFIVKGGLLIPKFNRLNEIKNRMPLLPYIQRPLVYEASISGIIDLSSYLPERSLLQVEGVIPSGDNEIEYAIHIDYSEKDYFLAGNPDGATQTGSDTSDFAIKGLGARIGTNVGSFSFGLSGTYDRDNQQSTLGEDVPRTRIGTDFTYTNAALFVEGEFIKVLLNPEADIEADKMFYYATLGYNFTDKLYGYGSYSYIDDEQFDFFKPGMKSIIFGLGYRPIFPVHLKVQAQKYWIDGDIDVTLDPMLPAVSGKVDLSVINFGVALSVLF